VNDEEWEVSRAAQKAAEDSLMEVDLHDDRTREFTSDGQSRMRTSWREDDGEDLAVIHRLVDETLLQQFGDGYLIMNDLYEIVREPVVGPGGVIETDQYGFTRWERTESGSYIEDYSKLGTKEIRDFLFKITTRLFDWEQKAATLWGDAMYAKALWEGRFSRGYLDSRTTVGKTVEDRTQAGRDAAMADRFFGIFQSVLSRRSDVLVRSMTLLSQRMKDVLSV
jgi:hypothetical protein